MRDSDLTERLGREGDIRNLQSLVEVIIDVAAEHDSSDKIMMQVQHLLWIARDLAERLTEAAAACHHKVMDERKAAA